MTLSPKDYSGDNTVVFTIDVEVRGRGEQAGLYVYRDDGAWVKVVKEMTGSGVYLVFASQHDSVPFVAGKVPLNNNSSVVAVQVVIGEMDVTVSYCEGGDGPWDALPTTVAVPTPPAPWSLLLLSEQMGRQGATVGFTVKRAGGGPPGNNPSSRKREVILL